MFCLINYNFLGLVLTKNLFNFCLNFLKIYKKKVFLVLHFISNKKN